MKLTTKITCIFLLILMTILSVNNIYSSIEGVKTYKELKQMNKEFSDKIKDLENEKETDDVVRVIYGEYDKEEYESQWAGNTDLSLKDCPLDEDLQIYIRAMSDNYNIDHSLTFAIIEKESQYKADTISSTNDYGLMQINKINHKWLSSAVGVTDFLDPYQNVEAGLYVLRTLFEKYEGNISMTLMAYNMGEGNAQKLWDMDIYESSYSKQVLEIQKRIQEENK